MIPCAFWRVEILPIIRGDEKGQAGGQTHPGRPLRSQFGMDLELSGWTRFARDDKRGNTNENAADEISAASRSHADVVSAATQSSAVQTVFLMIIPPARQSARPLGRTAARAEAMLISDMFQPLTRSISDSLPGDIAIDPDRGDQALGHGTRLHLR